MPVYIDVPELIENLRSGEFTQGKGTLHNYEKDTYCCLGVACAALEAKGHLITSKGDSNTLFRSVEIAAIDSFTGSYSFLPNGVEWPPYIGINGGSGIFIEFPDDRRGVFTSLIALNDEGFTFSQIADLIQYLHDNPVKETADV